jgi:CDP-glycerol glycerophosphotransferase (TagB/SpsB family)
MKYFTTSSQSEHEIIVDEFGYKPEEVPITGLCRWDVLEDKKTDEDKFILLMPTWRAWLEEVSDELFVQSDYYQNYSRLLTDKRLAGILDENNVNLVLYLHPKFAEYTETFKDKMSSRVRCIAFGEQSLNELLMRCHMLITDYSSVCWDAHYINKPVLFYQFDYEKYNLAHGSYINLETDLFGDRTCDRDELIDYIEEYIKSGLKTKPEYEKLAYDYFMYHDHNNSKRTFDFIKSQGY